MIRHLAVVLVVAMATWWTVSTTAAAGTDADAPVAVPEAVAATEVLASIPEELAAVPEERAAPDARNASAWRGEVRRAANVRRGPHTSTAVVRELAPGTPVAVVRWVPGDVIEPDNPTWAEIGPGEFVYAMALRPAALPPPVARPDRASAGKWIDVDLTHQIVTAYEGERPVRTTYASTGQPGWETPIGTWRIQRRVADETMDGATLIGQGPGGKGATYRVEHVRWTQYFTPDGSAIHENSWRDPVAFGIPGSHGCIGLTPTEAAWFWSWATTGTPIIIHS